MGTIIALGIAGSVGAIARYAVEGFVSNRFGESFPWGTLVVNASGSFVLGLLFTAFVEGRLGSPPWLRTAVTVGFIGAYTTFSTFTFETLRLIEDGSYLHAVLNVFGGILLGLVAVFLGVAVGRVLS